METTPKPNDMTPEQISILMQLTNVQNQIDELNQQAKQLTAALFPPVKRSTVKPFNKQEYLSDLKRMGVAIK